MGDDEMDATKLARVSREITLSDGHRIVLLDAPTDGSWSTAECQENIYRLDGSDLVVWQVKAGTSKFSSDAFVSLSLTGGKLKASRFFGTDFEIDLATGEAAETGWSK